MKNYKLSIIFFALIFGLTLLTVFINYANGWKFAGHMLLERGISMERMHEDPYKDHPELRYGALGSELDAINEDETVEGYGGFFNFTNTKEDYSRHPSSGMFMLLEFLIFIWAFKLISRSAKEVVFGSFLIFIAYYLMLWARGNDFYSNCMDFCGFEQFLLMPILIILLIITLSRSLGHKVILILEKRKEKNMISKNGEKIGKN